MELLSHEDASSRFFWRFWESAYDIYWLCPQVLLFSSLWPSVEVPNIVFFLSSFRGRSNKAHTSSVLSLQSATPTESERGQCRSSARPHSNNRQRQSSLLTSQRLTPFVRALPKTRNFESTTTSSWRSNSLSFSQETQYMIWNSKMYYFFQNSPPLHPILCQTNPTHTITSYL